MNLKDHPTYKLYSVQDLYAVPPPPMLVEKMLPRGTVTGLSSFPGVGKTWLALDLARSTATGSLFLGQFRARTGNTIFVGEDASLQDYALQLRKLTHREFEQYEQEVGRGERLVNPLQDHVHFIVRSGILLEKSEHVRQLAATIVQHKHSESVTYTEGGIEWSTESGADLVILDTQSAMTRVDQNDNTMMEVVYRNIRWLAAETGCAVVLLHHNSYPSEHNDGERWRGASSQLGALDNWFHLSMVPRSKKRLPGGGHTWRVLLKVKRFRGLTPDDLHYRMMVNDTDAVVMHDQQKVEVVAASAKNAILLALDLNEFLSVEQLAKKAGPTLFDMGIAVDDTELEGMINRVLVEELGNTIELGPDNQSYRVKVQ